LFQKFVQQARWFGRIHKNDFNVTFLATLDSWGGARGQTAHTSARTQQPIDLVTEIETLKLILQGIEDFETKVIPLLTN